MAWTKVTTTDGKPVFINLGLVAHISIDAPSSGAISRSLIQFTDLSGGIGLLAVREEPAEILKNVSLI